jgi:hypothetical protein
LGAKRGALLDNVFCCFGYKMLGEITLLVDGGVFSRFFLIKKLVMALVFFLAVKAAHHQAQE